MQPFKWEIVLLQDTEWQHARATLWPKKPMIPGTNTEASALQKACVKADDGFCQDVEFSFLLLKRWAVWVVWTKCLQRIKMLA